MTVLLVRDRVKHFRKPRAREGGLRYEPEYELASGCQNISHNKGFSLANQTSRWEATP